MEKSWNIPRLDVYDPSLVLYAPLWRPDMVARGGAIKNGTGALSVSPIAMAVGANTITVSTLGTFIVNMPEGGTVASGTTTVTGSPVTVSAGIATTITTTGSTGTITCTTNNIIRSKDRNNRSLTIAGATWGYQGRTFDGSDDSILLPGSISSDNITLIFWIKHTLQATEAAYLYSQNTDELSIYAGVNNYTFQAFYDGLGVSQITTTGVWSHVAWTFTKGGTGYSYLNGVQQDSDANSATAPSGGTTYIARQSGIAANPYKGDVGEFLQYNRALTGGEVMNHYLATKWRYV